MTPRLSPADVLAAKREYCRRSLSNFIRLAWPVIEPGQPYVHGWHIDAMAEHLEAVARSEITRLYIAVPPGSMKSLMVSVFFPAWRWIDQPSTRVIAASHAERLAIRDNMRCRRLVQSEWYQSLFGDRVQLVADQNAKTKFENTATGFREAMPFTSLTGSRGDFVGIDDPLSVDDAASPAKREAVTQTFLEAVPTRLNNPDRSAIVAIQQRLHERDVIGVIEAKELGYDALVIPMEYEPDTAQVTSIGWRDPRTKAGELMFPERFPRDVLDGLRASLGGFAWAAQMQQRPVPREGGMFARHWFEVVDAPPAGARRVRRWDLAATAASGANDPDWTVGLRMSEADGVFYVEDVKRMRETPAGVERAIVSTASQDGAATMVRLPQDPGQAGKAQAAYLVGKLAGYDARAEPETGAKDVRAVPVAAQAEAGNVKLVRGPWNEAFLEEIGMFPNGAHDDQVDALSGAFGALAKPKASPFAWAMDAPT